MESFRTEIEDPIVQKTSSRKEKSIYSKKVRLMRAFSQPSLGTWRLWSASGRCSNDTYQVAFGKVTGEQLWRISKVSDEYSTGRLHITTRQDIQIHYVSLDRTPELWAELKRRCYTS
jgi:sulfite reductase (ferredoxin)